MPDKTDKDPQGGLAQFARNSSRGMAPALGSPNMQAIANKIRANLTPPESVMDPRYAPWKKNLDDAEAFSIASDLALSAAPFAGPAVKLGRKAASSVGRQAGEALNTRVLSGQPLIPGLPGFVAPNPLAFVIKPKGGNWVDSPRRPLSDELGSLKWNMDAFPEEAAIDKWIDTKLERYIKNEMASPDDPVRAYLEAFPARKQAMLEDKQRQIDKAVADMEKARDARGVHPEMLTRSQERIRELEKEKALIEERQGLHYTPRRRFAEARVANNRQEAGFPREGMATGRQAKSWELEADDAIASRSAGQFIASNPTQYEIRGRQTFNPLNTTKSSMDDAEAELEALRAERERLNTRFGYDSPTVARLQENFDDILNTPNPTASGPLVDNPFIAKLPLQTPLYGLRREIGRFGNDNLGFSHLTDELRNAMRAGEQGLPESLALRPKDLDKMTVPQVIEHVDKINAWRAAQKAEVNAAIANNAATMLHKEYATIPGTDLPNTRGLRWVEIKQPKSATVGEYADPMFDIPQEQQDIFRAQATREAIRRGLDDESDEFMMAVQDRVHDLSQDWARINKPMNKELQDALTFEGQQMAHCVGGYCQDVMSGRSRIFSLRDAKGKPYTTIEVKPMSGSELGRHAATFSDDEAAAIMKNPPHRVTQVKAYRDRKPDDAYIPFVQDFIRSNKFPIVGDMPNTNLLPKSNYIDEFTSDQLDTLGDSEYVTLDELQKLRATRAAQPADNAPTNLLPPEGDMKKGGPVRRSGPVSQDAMQMQVWDKALRRQIGGASEPTQAEIEAAMRPETVSPRLRALANRVKTQPGVPITDRLVGAGEAATSLASGILGSVPAGYEGMAELLRSRDPARAAQAVETGLQRYTYQPRTATGMQEAQAGAHLLEKLDAPSQYVGNYMLEQTGSPAAATAAQIILDPLNFLPGPKQLASTVRGVPQMLQDAAIQAYGPGATASHVVPPQGNLNLTPHASAELLKGPDRQPVGNFLKQLQGTPGVTKEGLEEGLAATRVLDPTSVVTKAEFEKYATPSKYEKFEIEHDAANSEYHHELFEQAIEDVHDEFQNMPAFDYLGYEMGIPPRYAEDFNTLVQQSNMPHFADATSLSELEAYGISRELITLLERNDITTPEAFDRAIDYHTRQAINEQAEVRVEMHLAEQDEPPNYNTRQRLVTEDSRAALPFTAYQEIGVRHPNQQDDYKHFPGQRNMVGHFRGTMVPADWRRGVELENGAGTIPPGAFLIEELQSDAQQSGDTTKHLHQVHGVVAKAAIQHALEQGAHTVYVPTSSAIIDVREGLGNNDKNTLRRVYDKEVPSQAIEPLRKIPGVTITTTNPTASTNPKDRKFLFHVITFTDAAREHILRGLGQRTPGYAKGGPVSRDAMWMAVQDKQLRKKHGN
jgi:hypothetical protein